MILTSFLLYFLPVPSFLQSDAISSANPRVIDDSRARKLSNDLKRCTYYETCATYGLNVERVFQDGKGLFVHVCVFACVRVSVFGYWVIVRYKVWHMRLKTQQLDVVFW